MKISRRDFVAGCGVVAVAPATFLPQPMSSAPIADAVQLLGTADANLVLAFVDQVEACGMQILASSLDGGHAFRIYMDLVDTADVDEARGKVLERLMAWHKLPDWQDRKRSIIRYLITTGRVQQVS